MEHPLDTLLWRLKRFRGREVQNLCLLAFAQFLQKHFMTISEAASLVLLSAAFGTAGGVFVLDMGAEVRIVEVDGYELVGE